MSKKLLAFVLVVAVCCGFVSALSRYCLAAEYYCTRCNSSTTNVCTTGLACSFMMGSEWKVGTWQETKDVRACSGIGVYCEDAAVTCACKSLDGWQTDLNVGVGC